MIMTSCGVRKTSPARSVGSWLLMPQLTSDFSFVYGSICPACRSQLAMPSSPTTPHDSRCQARWSPFMTPESQPTGSRLKLRISRFGTTIRRHSCRLSVRWNRARTVLNATSGARAWNYPLEQRRQLTDISSWSRQCHSRLSTAALLVVQFHRRTISLLAKPQRGHPIVGRHNHSPTPWSSQCSCCPKERGPEVGPRVLARRCHWTGATSHLGSPAVRRRLHPILRNWGVCRQWPSTICNGLQGKVLAHPRGTASRQRAAGAMGV